MIAKEDTRNTRERRYKNKLHGMKKYNKKTKSKNLVVLKRKFKADSPPLIYQSTAPEFNFLKYLRVVKRWVRVKYNMSTSDLEIFLFLYDEGIWKLKEFNQAEEIHNWERNRLKRYLERGWVRVWREGKGYKGYAKLYELTPKAKRIVKSFYLKLTQNEAVPENKQNNPMFLTKNESYTMDAYKNAISRMNSKREETRRDNNHYDN